MGGNVLLIQIILLAAVAGIAVLLTRSTAGARHQAIRRLCLLLFVVGAAASVIFPQVLSRVANAVGVGRGADLLLYALVIAFLSYISTSHRRMNRMSRQITLLTRELTLSEARSEAEAAPEVHSPATPSDAADSAAPVEVRSPLSLPDDGPRAP